MRHVGGAGGVILKGSGFHRTDYRSGASKAAAKAEKDRIKAREKEKLSPKAAAAAAAGIASPAAKPADARKTAAKRPRTAKLVAIGGFAAVVGTDSGPRHLCKSRTSASAFLRFSNENGAK